MSAPLTPTTRDRFDLDRLAEELAEREGNDGGGSSDAALALPVFTPLARDNEYLSAEQFDVERFLLSRIAYSDLPDLRGELREYLGALKEELVQLINDDYEAFISLSTDLRGEGETLERLQQPLGGLKDVVLVSAHTCACNVGNRAHGPRCFFVRPRNQNSLGFKGQLKPSSSSGLPFGMRR
jgi:hypothetical protein